MRSEHYYIYNPIKEHYYSYIQCRGRERIAAFASKAEAHVFFNPVNAICVLKSLPCTKVHLQVINEYGEVLYGREVNYLQKNFL